MWKLEVESGALMPTIGDLAYVVLGAVAMHICQLSLKTTVFLLPILVAVVTISQYTIYSLIVSE